MAERHVRILQDTDRGWICIILLGFLWLGLPLPNHTLIAWIATLALAVLFGFSFGQRWLRHPIGFRVLMAVLGGLVLLPVVRLLLENKAERIDDFRLWIVGLMDSGWLPRLEAIGILIAIAVGAIGLIFWAMRCRMELTGASFEIVRRGLLVPLILCGLFLLWIGDTGPFAVKGAVRAAIALPFLFHFYAYWPRQRWISRWVWLLLIVFAATSGFDRLNDSEAWGQYFGAVKGFVGMIWDFARLLTEFDDPGVNAFFLGKPLDFDYDRVLDFLGNLELLETCGIALAPAVALALPLLVAVRLARGEPQSHPFRYAAWMLALSAATAFLWSSEVSLGLYRPQFFAHLCAVWLARGLPLQIILSVGFFASRPLSRALAGLQQSAEDQSLAPSPNAIPCEDAAPLKRSAGRFSRGCRAVFSERIWLPPLCAIPVLSAILGGVCCLECNKELGTFKGVIEPRPGQKAAGPILEPLFTRNVSKRIYFFGGSQSLKKKPDALLLNMDDYWISHTSRRLPLPGKAACDRVTSLTQQAEARRYLDAFAEAAQADVCGWKTLTPEKRVAAPDYVPLRETAWLIGAQACVAAASGQWGDARRHIQMLIRFGAILGSEGNLVQRMIGCSMRRVAIRSAFQALQHCPRDQIGELFAMLESLDPWMQRLAFIEDIEEAEPALRWPSRFLVPSLWLPGTQRAMMVDQVDVAQFRLLLMAGAARVVVAEKGRLPTAEDLQTMFGRRLPRDPFTGGEFDAQFSADRVRFSTSKNALPERFGFSTVFLSPPKSRMLAIVVNTKGEVSVE